MPNSTSATHPSNLLDITFTEDDHRYIDSFDIEYISTTTLIHSAFPAFDAQKVAAQKSSRTGIPAAQYRQEWEAAGKAASESGTRAHENCERQILGRFNEMHQPRDEQERRRFCAAWEEVENLKRQFPMIEPEKLVFSPRFKVAGSIDLFCSIDRMNYALGDWKYIKNLPREGFKGAMGIHPATIGLPDCKFSYYALQLNVYEMLLKVEGYIPMTAHVWKFLKRYDSENGVFEHVDLPDLRTEALMLMAYHVTSDNLTDPTPF